MQLLSTSSRLTTVLPPTSLHRSIVTLDWNLPLPQRAQSLGDEESHVLLHGDVAQRRFTVAAGDAHRPGLDGTVNGQVNRVDLDPPRVVRLIDFALDVRKLNIGCHLKLLL